MNMQYTQSQRIRRDAAHSRVLLVIAAMILVAGLFLQITMLAKISSQNKAAAAMEKEIIELSASADNLELSINQHHNLQQIAVRAQQLGMSRPTESQIRVVSVARSAGNTFTQTAENIGGEEILN